MIDITQLVDESAKRYHETIVEKHSMDNRIIPGWFEIEEDQRAATRKVAYSFIAPVVSLLQEDIIRDISEKTFLEMTQEIYKE